MFSSAYSSARRGQSARVALIMAVQLAAVCSHADVSTYVTAGVSQNVKVESGTWTTSNGYLVPSAGSSTVSIGDIITTGDFRFTATIRGTSFSSNPGLLLINGIGELGFVRTTSDSTMFTRGFFFGDITRNLSHRSTFFEDGSDFNIEVNRSGDTARVLINGLPVWQNTYEGDRQFGKIGFRNGSGGLKIKSASLITGSYGPMSEWKNQQTAVHEQPGEQVDVFARGSGGYHTYRIPAVERTRSGVLLAFCEGRKNSASDSGEIHLLSKRSLDNGKTWSEPQIIYSEPGAVTIGNPVPVHYRRINRTYLAFCRNNDRVFMTHSNDDGVTWVAPKEITSQVKLPGWDWYATGPGHGLVTSAGRIIIPANHGSKAHCFYSDDHGHSWQLGNDMPGYGNEVTVAETAEGAVLMNSRNSSNANFRKMATSSDGGATWSAPQDRRDLVEPTCQGAIRSAVTETGENLLLFSNPASVRRERMTVRYSENGGTTWSVGKRLYEGSAAYSDLVYLGDGWMGCLYERDWYKSITFARFHLSWLRDSRIENWYEGEVSGN